MAHLAEVRARICAGISLNEQVYESAWLGDVAGNPDVGKRSKKIQAIKYLFEKNNAQRKGA